MALPSIIEYIAEQKAAYVERMGFEPYAMMVSKPILRALRDHAKTIGVWEDIRKMAPDQIFGIRICRSLFDEPGRIEFIP